jgi:hypothetical protein
MNPVRPNVVSVQSMPRPTPTPPRVKFGEVLAGGARGLVRGATSAMSMLPGGPLMAVAIRGGGAVHAPGGSAALRPEGPGGAGAGVGAEAGGIESSLAQAQEMNLYYLQLQEAVNAQNRTFTALSNVLKAEHDTVKTAIGNIR